MAAKIYSGVENVLAPKFKDFDFISASGRKAYDKACEDYVNKIISIAKENNQGDLVGETIDFPVADGKALYVVYSQKPLQLIHIETYDAWHFDMAHLLTVTEVRKKLKQRKELEKLFGK